MGDQKGVLVQFWPKFAFSFGRKTPFWLKFAMKCKLSGSKPAKKGIFAKGYLGFFGNSAEVEFPEDLFRLSAERQKFCWLPTNSHSPKPVPACVSEMSFKQELLASRCSSGCWRDSRPSSGTTLTRASRNQRSWRTSSTCPTPSGMSLAPSCSREQTSPPSLCRRGGCKCEIK